MNTPTHFFGSGEQTTATVRKLALQKTARDIRNDQRVKVAAKVVGELWWALYWATGILSLSLWGALAFCVAMGAVLNPAGAVALGGSLAALKVWTAVTVGTNSVKGARAVKARYEQNVRFFKAVEEQKRGLPEPLRKLPPSDPLHWTPR